ncbi:MAG: RNA polymerase sigma factor [Muribaculaceae bacterium]|nr:RNA polymerase sigma factor [Muribaculaceae bacterium]
MRGGIHRSGWHRGLLTGVGLVFRGLWCALSVALGGVEQKRELQKRFETLIATHSALISRICFSYAADNEDYNDLRQDVLINIWKGISSFRGDSSSLTWVYRVTLNTCVSTVRKRSRRPATERLDTMPLDIPEEREEEGLRERFETLHRLISELSPIDKAIVTMWLDERSYDEIAEVVGMSKNNIGLRLHRIKERWRKQSKIS